MDPHVQLCNQLAELDLKAQQDAQLSSIARNLKRMRHNLEELGYRYHIPLGEAYSEGRSDCDANLLDGAGGDTLHITKVLKPAVYREENGSTSLLQKAVVIVEAV